MIRDRDDYSDMWVLYGDAEQAIEYRVGIPEDIDQRGALVIIDEVDSIMFEDPSKFLAFI